MFSLLAFLIFSLDLSILSNGWLLGCFKISEMQSMIKISPVFLKFWDGWAILLNSNSSVVWLAVVDHIQDWSLQITSFCLMLFLSSIIHKIISWPMLVLCYHLLWYMSYPPFDCKTLLTIPLGNTIGSQACGFNHNESDE